MGCFVSLFQPILSVCCQKAHFFVPSDHRKQSHLKFQSCLTTEYVGENFLVKVLFQYFFFFLLSPKTCGDVGAVWSFCLRFSDPETQLNYFLNLSSCGLWRVFSHSNSPPHHALGQYRHTLSSRPFRIIFCWLEIPNYCPALALFLKPLSNLWCSIIFCCTLDI